MNCVNDKELNDLTSRKVAAQVIEYASYMAEKEPKDLAQIYLDYAAKYLHADTTLDQAYKNKFGAELDEEQVNQNIKMVIVAAKMDDGTEHIIRYLEAGMRTKSWTGYAKRPTLCLYSRGLKPPRDSLIRLWLYQWI